MKQDLVHVAVVVENYDEAIDFYVNKLHFDLIEDTRLSETKRWVLVRPKGSVGTSLLLAEASKEEQHKSIGNQTGGRVFLFLHTDNFKRDYQNLLDKNIKIVRKPVTEEWGQVCVFEDLYGNLWDLIEPTEVVSAVPVETPRTRQRIISSILGLLLLGAAFYYSGIIKSSKKEPSQKVQNQITNVIYTPIKLKSTTVDVESNGVLSAKNKIDIISRTQGIFERSDKSFRSGVYFAKGEVLVEIEDDEYKVNLRSTKAQLLQSLTSILGELKFDHADAFEKWNGYVNRFDVNKSLEELPASSSEREKAFINSKNIITQYYSIKAQEVKAAYYQIRAPFSGILRENLVDKGAMVNAGQKLGTLIGPSVFELELKISPAELRLIKVGKSVKLVNNDKSKSWNGKVTRINKVIDPQSQSALVIVEVRGKELSEGMFMQAEISTVDLMDVAEVPRNLLIDDSKVFVIKDSTLQKQDIKVLHVAEKSVFVTGLQEDTWILQKMVSGAYEGMKVNPINLID